MTDLARELAARLDYYRELGIYDFYQRGDGDEADGRRERATLPGVLMAEDEEQSETAAAHIKSKEQEPTIPRRPSAPPAPSSPIKGTQQPVPPLIAFGPVLDAAQRPSALDAIRTLIGDCTRCRLAEGRNKLVFADGDPNARLMFVGEGPGADEDAQGLPFVGRAGQLLNNMINAMGLKREQVYIANIVKCRPPQNRKPEPDEAHTCTPFLERQIEVVRPTVLVALGATAATYLLDMRGSIASMRGRTHDYRGIQTIVTYHPAYLLRDPTQKKEAWKDLQAAMSILGLKAPSRVSPGSPSPS